MSSNQFGVTADSLAWKTVEKINELDYTTDDTYQRMTAPGKAVCMPALLHEVRKSQRVRTVSAEFVIVSRYTVETMQVRGDLLYRTTSTVRGDHDVFV